MDQFLTLKEPFSVKYVVHFVRIDVLMALKIKSPSNAQSNRQCLPINH